MLRTPSGFGLKPVALGFEGKWQPGLGAMFEILPDVRAQVAKNLIFARMLTQDVSRAKMGSKIEQST